MELKKTPARAIGRLGRVLLGLGLVALGAVGVADGGRVVDWISLVAGVLAVVAALLGDEDEAPGFFSRDHGEMRRGLRLPFRVLAGMIALLCVLPLPMYARRGEWYAVAYFGMGSVVMLAVATVGYLWPASVWRERRRRVAAGADPAGALGPGDVDWNQAVEREKREERR